MANATRSSITRAEHCPCITVGSDILAPRRTAFTNGQMYYGDVAFDADLTADVLGNLTGAPALDKGDVKLRKPAVGHVAMVAAPIVASASQTQAALSAGPYPRPPGKARSTQRTHRVRDGGGPGRAAFGNGSESSPNCLSTSDHTQVPGHA